MTFGIDAPADVRATRRRARARRRDGCVETPAGRVDLDTRCSGGNLANVLAAGRRAPLRRAARRDRRAPRALPRAPSRRAAAAPGGITLIDDSYNSSPSALARALEIVAARDGQRAQGRRPRRDARARGSHAASLHRECGARRTAGSTCSWRSAAPPPRSARRRVDAGMAPRRRLRRHERGGGGRASPRRVRDGDLVLVKGSRGIGPMRVVERLKAEFA
jgi:UDP-N-acetylmuramoyl-tripeptide--D-alanyl-D-alanine ligase